MKTKILDLTRRALFAALIPAAVALPVMSGCVADDPATATASQGLGANCMLEHPIGWSVGNTSCTEFLIPVGAPPILETLQDGQSETFTASPGGGFGRGSVTIQCQNGFPAQLRKTCSRVSGGGGGGEP